MLEYILATAGLLACLGALAHMAIGPARRVRLAHWLRGLRHWRRTRDTARREAQNAIDRARRGQGGEWDGNVYRPKSFGKERKDRPH